MSDLKEDRVEERTRNRRYICKYAYVEMMFAIITGCTEQISEIRDDEWLTGPLKWLVIGHQPVREQGTLLPTLIYLFMTCQ